MSVRQTLLVAAASPIFGYDLSFATFRGCFSRQWLVDFVHEVQLQGPKEIVIMPRADHGGDHKDYYAKYGLFLDKHLKN